MGTYSFSGSPQFVTVGQTGIYDIAAFGAQGGNSSTYGTTGGKGAEEGGSFTLTSGERLEIVVGGAGGSSNYGGGGGGTFVLANTGAGGAFAPLLIAGGGGGAYRLAGGSGTVAAAGSGSGGTVTGQFTGGGGSGVKSDGATSTYGGGGGDNLSGAYAGGTGRYGGGNGGFGGGGGGGVEGGGGGGGYTGGSGGYEASGVGGTSFDSGTAIAAQTMAGVQTGNGSLSITPNAAVCYCTGTLIRTTRGDVAVEHLAVGDMAVTASGEYRPVRWIGHQTHRLAGPAQPRSAWPVRVAAGAFGKDRPDRDLFLSPGHSVCLGLFDEVLVPVQELVNGSTVAYVEDATDVTYWHVELDSHDILIANNMPAESFLEMGTNRAMFVDGRRIGDPSAEVVGRTHADFCRRFVDGGPLLATMRDELAIRAGSLGWQPERTVVIRCTADGQPVAGHVGEGEAVFALPAGVGEVRIASDMTLPALHGEADPRRIGLAVYAITLPAAGGEVHDLDLDDPAVAGCFHAGERAEGLHYRYSAGDIVLPASVLARATAALPGALLLHLRYEASTLRGWREPEHRPQKPALRVVG